MIDNNIDDNGFVPPPFQCHLCGKIYASKQGLIKHICKQLEKCPRCEGSGTYWMGLEAEVECSECLGEGTKNVNYMHPNQLFSKIWRGMFKDMSPQELRTLRAIINGKLSRRTLTTEQSKAMLEARKQKAAARINGAKGGRPRKEAER